jgi:hypothetical protein
MPVFLATLEAEIKRIMVFSQPRQKARPYLKNAQHKKRLLEWLKWYSACLVSPRL